MNFHIGSFGCGVLFSLILLYIGTLHRIEIGRNDVSQPAILTNDSRTVVFKEPSTDKPPANETSALAAERKYSVKDQIENSTFGVGKICKDWPKLHSQPTSLRRY